MRNAVAAAVTGALLLAPAATPPAAAQGGVVLTCAMHYNLWGVDTIRGTGDCTAVGMLHGAVVNGPVHLDFLVRWSPSCTGSGTYTGGLAGVIDGNLAITRVGDDGVATTTGDLTGAGPMHVIQRSPVGLACGGAADETAIFFLGGA